MPPPGITTFLIDIDDPSDPHALAEAIAAAQAEARRQEGEARRGLAEDAARDIADPAAFPLDHRPLTIVSVARHLRALSGFTEDELDEILHQEPGSTATTLRGERDAMTASMVLDDFTHICRQVAATLPEESVRSWWEEKHPRRRLCPLDFVRRGRLRDKAFAPYLQELHCNGETVSRLCAFHEGGYFELGARMVG